MDNLTTYPNTIERILTEYAAIPYGYGEINQYVIVNPEKTQFLLFNEGWTSKRRVHGCLVHVQIKNGKIWIHYDGLEDGITDELVAAGIPKDKIVIAFHPPAARSQTGYAVA